MNLEIIGEVQIKKNIEMNQSMNQATISISRVEIQFSIFLKMERVKVKRLLCSFLNNKMSHRSVLV